MDGNYGNAVNQGLAGTGAIVADNGANVAGTAIMNAAPGLGAATTAGAGGCRRGRGPEAGRVHQQEQEQEQEQGATAGGTSRGTLQEP